MIFMTVTTNIAVKSRARSDESLIEQLGPRGDCDGRQQASLWLRQTGIRLTALITKELQWSFAVVQCKGN
jgi:hypothetical protein